MARQNAMKLLDTGDSSFVAKVERILPPASFGNGNGMRVSFICLFLILKLIYLFVL